MTGEQPNSISSLPPLGKDFFLARQPILDRDQQLIAYELLFRNADTGSAGVNEDLFATASVIAHLAELGLDQVAGDMLAFVNIDAGALHSGILAVLPPEKVVLEILETVEVTPQLLAQIRDMKEAGFTFALDDVVAHSAPVASLLTLAGLVKVDILGMPRHVLSSLARRLAAPGRKLLAEKVETQAEFELCKALGFDYFQGYYFAKPVVLAGKKLTPSELALLHLLDLIERDADIGQIEQAVKFDALLGLNLLRLVNTPAFDAKGRVDSLAQALRMLGQKQLKRWLQILLFAKAGKGGAFDSPLLALATTRARLLELIAGKYCPRQDDVAQTGFTVGILSLMDALFSLPMATLLEKIMVAEPVRVALLQRQGQYGRMLRVAETLEQGGAPDAADLQRFGLRLDVLNQLQLQAFDWANKIADKG
jgi:EAL and modified HD-GYP domain-containing signal transduction protein